MSQTSLTKPLCVQRAKVEEMGTEGPGVLQHNLSFHKGKGRGRASPKLAEAAASFSAQKKSSGTVWDREIRELGCSLQLSSCNQSQLQD